NGTAAIGTPAQARNQNPELRAQRDRLLQRFTVLQMDLGGAFYEMAIRDHVRLYALTRHAAELQRVDTELAQVERKIELVRTAVKRLARARADGADEEGDDRDQGAAANQHHHPDADDSAAYDDNHPAGADDPGQARLRHLPREPRLRRRLRRRGADALPLRDA